MTRSLLILIILFAYTPIHSATINVPADQPTIQAGIDVASDGDTVLVAPGIYYENVDNRQRDICIVSKLGYYHTFIVGVSSLKETVSLYDADALGVELSGFSVSGGGRAGIRCQNGKFKIRRNRIVGNRSSLSSFFRDNAGGIRLHQSNGSIVEHNEICDNVAQYGSAIYMDSCSNDTISYNLMYNNTGIGEIRTEYTTNALIHNNTISVFTQGIVAANGCVLDIRSNIFTNSRDYAVHLEHHDTAYVGYNCFWNNRVEYKTGFNCLISNVGGDIALDPLFLNSSNGQYSLSPGSPCIDAGDPDPAFDDTDGSRADIGAISCNLAADSDGDGLVDCLDNCPFTSNTSQLDSDEDAIGDICDQCPNDGMNDSDKDGYCSTSDNCPLISNIDQSDTDFDGMGDVCDPCPVDPLNPACCDLAGDADDSGTISIGDVTHIIGYIFAGSVVLVCYDEADANGSGNVEIGDATFLIQRIFAFGPKPICGRSCI